MQMEQQKKELTIEEKKLKSLRKELTYLKWENRRLNDELEEALSHKCCLHGWCSR